MPLCLVEELAGGSPLPSLPCCLHPDPDLDLDLLPGRRCHLCHGRSVESKDVRFWILLEIYHIWFRILLHHCYSGRPHPHLAGVWGLGCWGMRGGGMLRRLCLHLDLQ